MIDRLVFHSDYYLYMKSHLHFTGTNILGTFPEPLLKTPMRNFSLFPCIATNPPPASPFNALTADHWDKNIDELVKLI